MFSFKIILGSLAVAVICDLIAMQYYPQGGSRIRGSLEKFRNLIHKLADLFCNNPAECKQVTDEFFGILSDIPQDVVVRFMEFVGNAQDHGSVQKNQDAAKKGAVDFTNGEVEVKGDERKAEMIIKTLKFASYNENNLCDLKEGIPPEEYDVTVDEIADLTSMPENLKKTIKRAKNFTSGNVLAVNKLQFKAADGNLVFGRVAVIRRGKVLDMAYSLHSVEYELMPKQRQPDNADKLEQFSGSLYHEEGEPNDFEGVSIGLRDDFLAFFHRQAIKGFVKHCDYVLKAITHGDGVVRALGVQNGDETETWQKMNTEPVCFGARDNQYGAFLIPKSGRLKAMKLIYKSGGVTCNPYFSTTFWGCRHEEYGNNALLTVITDANKKTVMPPVEFLKTSSERCGSKKDFYSLDGTTHSSPELVFPDLSIPLSVSRDQELQIWYTHDLIDCTEDNNSGETCVDVYGWYA